MAGGNVGEFGELSVIRQITKQSKLVLIINNLLIDLLIRQTFFVKCLKQVNSPTFSPPKFPSIRYIETVAIIINGHGLGIDTCRGN